MVNLNKFYKREILIQPPGEPREQHLGDVRPKSSSYTKFHKKQNDRKGRYTMANFWKNRKKVKNEVTGTEKRRIWLIYLKTFHTFTFLGPVTSILIFLQFSQICARLDRPFQSFCLLWKFCNSNFYNSFFSSIVEKLNISKHGCLLRENCPQSQPLPILASISIFWACFL